MSLRLAARLGVIARSVMIVGVLAGLPAGSAAIAQPVQFDLPQLVSAVPVACTAVDGDDHRLVHFDLTLSIIVDSFPAPTIDQLVVDVNPQGGTAMVVDYAPRTELASQYNGDIEVLHSEEQNRLVTLSLQSQHPGVVSGGLTGTQGQKQAESLKYQRVAPLHLIAASGTTQRGRAVYFKFRSTDRQIIEGERTLGVTLRVPQDWQGELIDVQITADSQSSGLSTQVASWAGLGTSPQRVGAARFLVAAYRSDCVTARSAARDLSAAESQLRREVQRLQSVASTSGTDEVPSGTLWTPVARGLDWNRSQRQELARAASLALHRALAGTLDVHADRSLRGLPVDTRAALVEYDRVRRRFLQLNHPTADHSSLTVAGT